MNANIEIRSERLHDFNFILKLNDSAFNTVNTESRLVDSLRNQHQFNKNLSLVAAQNDIDSQYEIVVGHVLLYPIQIIDGNNIELGVKLLALAPLAVLLTHQRKGIGLTMVNESLIRAKQERYDTIFVLGHSEYYCNFGFESTLK